MKQETYIGVGDLLGIGMTLVVLVIGISFGLQVMGDIRTDMATENAGAGCNASHTYACGTAYNATGHGVEAIAKLPEKLGTIVTVVVAAVLIGLLIRYLWVRYSG